MLRTNFAIHLGNSRDTSLKKMVTISISDWRVSAYSLIVVSSLLIILSSLARGDEMTGLPQDDPKDLSYTTAGSSQPTTSFSFLPMPGWAHGALAPLPYQLTPMGKKPFVAVAPPPPQPLAPPKDTPAASPAPVAEPKETAKEKPAPTPAESPALIAVSPFLQWIKTNPRAADDARQQADAYRGAQVPTGPINGTRTITAGPSGNTNTEDPYWLPPLIDSGDLGASPVGGSAAIYSTPQR